MKGTIAKVMRLSQHGRRPCIERVTRVMHVTLDRFYEYSKKNIHSKNFQASGCHGRKDWAIVSCIGCLFKSMCCCSKGACVFVIRLMSLLHPPTTHIHNSTERLKVTVELFTLA